MKKNHKSSDLYLKIWETVNQIPMGKVATYGQIARIAGLGSHARVVGYALYSLPPGSDVHWHRVINSKGKISLPEETGHYDLQKMLLEDEGIIFNRDKVDLKKFGWNR